MNKRIRELYDQCIVGRNNDAQWIFEGDLDPEKFAQLIVRECLDIVTDAVDHREPASTYADKIREHFGVEE